MVYIHFCSTIADYYTCDDVQRYDPDPAAKAAAATVLASKLGADSGLQWYMGDDSNRSGSSTGKSNDVELVQSSGLRNRKQAQTRSAGTGTTSPNSADQQLVGSGSGGFDQTQGSEYNQPVVEHQPQSSNSQDAGWIARIAALLVGEDPTQSYALICGNCHMHNGKGLDFIVYAFVLLHFFIAGKTYDCCSTSFWVLTLMNSTLARRVYFIDLFMFRSCSKGGFPIYHLLLPALPRAEQTKAIGRCLRTSFP